MHSTDPRRDIIALVDRYVAALDAQDADAAADCFTATARQEDPAGEGVNHGRAAIHERFEQTFTVGFTARREGPVTVHGRFAAFRVRVEIPAGRTPFQLLSSTMVEVDRSGRFSSLVSVPDSRAASE